eukprot:CAMPEP_0173144392 /NCGR_PEP_ID=MMETSP1105-20130129/7203_1 /TAXON_ID=2985 /ORGANISM="Ochromonas sp., Strain BG-1" /LENGTH=86 /DNA_ID=CAMNT_0014058059 /DNA_START=178 /DNA_END=438 /DNA_ORIENTATION=-
MSSYFLLQKKLQQEEQSHASQFFQHFENSSSIFQHYQVKKKKHSRNLLTMTMKKKPMKTRKSAPRIKNRRQIYEPLSYEVVIVNQV